jgi:catechol 2,3-dioxygenase-like lactoylglutathione lyase family enzyme
MTTPILGYHNTSVHVNDIAKARTFYTDVFGLKELGFDPTIKAAYYEVPGANVPFVIHEYGAGCKQSGGRPPGTVSGIVFTVKNTEQAAQEFRSRGANITDEPHKAPWGALLATVADPDGNEFVLSTK